MIYHILENTIQHKKENISVQISKTWQVKKDVIHDSTITESRSVIAWGQGLREGIIKKQK